MIVLFSNPPVFRYFNPDYAGHPYRSWGGNIASSTDTPREPFIAKMFTTQPLSIMTVIYGIMTVAISTTDVAVDIVVNGRTWALNTDLRLGGGHIPRASASNVFKRQVAAA
jgi:hypothetical protein